MNRQAAIFVRCLLSATLIALIFRKVEWRSLTHLLAQADWRWLLAASALTPLMSLGMTVRWRVFLRAQGLDLPFKTAFLLTMAGQAFNCVLPGSTGGDAIKIYQLCRIHPERKARGAATILLDRIVALLALVTLAAIALVINPFPLHLLPSLNGWFPSLVLGLALLLALIFLGIVVFRRLHNTPWKHRLVRVLAAIKAGATLDNRLFLAFVLSCGLHLMTVSMTYLFAQALGLPLSYLQVFVMVPILALFVMLPLTINGHGLRELLLIAYFSQIGLTASAALTAGTRELAVALSLLQVSNDLFWSIPGAIWYIARYKSLSSAVEAKNAGDAILKAAVK